MRLQNKRVIITGGSTGIGAAVARRFLAEGAKVAVWCRNPDKRRRCSRSWGFGTSWCRRWTALTAWRTRGLQCRFAWIDRDGG